jgi:hypothetical protein
VANLENAVSIEIANDPRWIAVERIANSQCFHRCHRLRDFLFYISEQQLSGHPEEITEQNIGHRVYGRDEMYSPTEDNIVRVSARQLRIKLREFYETEGKQDSWIVEIPKGGYLPHFQKRETPPAAEKKAKEPSGFKPDFRYWLITTLLVSIAAVAAWRIPHRTPDLGGGSSGTNLITSLFRDSGQPVQVIVSDSALVLMQSTLDRRFTIDEYASQSYRQLPPNLIGNPQAQRVWTLLATRQIVNLGDVGAASRIRDALLTPGHESIVTTRSAQNMRARDFRSGNFILLGDPFSDPWAQLFDDDKLNFRFTKNLPQAEPVLLNTHPKPGELSSYSEATADSHGYARIAFVPNLTNSGRVLLIAGLSMESTESAANFCLGAQSNRILLSALGGTKTADLPFFEALLRTTKGVGTGLKAELVSLRALGRAP